VGKPTSDDGTFPLLTAAERGVVTSDGLIAWFDQMFANVQAGIVVTDQRGRILRSNLAYRRILGATEEEVTGRPFAERIHPDDRDANMVLVERLRTGRIPYFDIENRYLRPDGTEVWVSKFVSLLPVAGGLPHLVAVVTDTTGRRSADARLRTTEARFRALYDSAPVGIVEVGLDGRFLTVNEAFTRITSRSLEELQGMTFAEITHPDDLAEDLEQLGLLNAGEIERFAMQKRYLRPDGSAVWVHLSVSAVQSDDGTTSSYIASVEDVTERKELELAQHRRRQRAELIADVLTGLEVDGNREVSLQHLVDLLAGRFCDYATIEDPEAGSGECVLAIAHRDPDLVAPLFALRCHHPIDRNHPQSVLQVALGKGALVADTRPNLRTMPIPPEARELFARVDPRSHVAAPLALGADTRGVLLAGRGGEDTEPFTPDDLAFLQELAGRAGAALASADVRRREQQVSLHFQQALLPGRLAHAPTLAVSGSYAPATAALEVGGDWYDSIELSDGRILLVVGDVVGHGLEAAAVMGRLRSGLAALATTETDPGRLLTALDQFASGPHGADFATVCCATVDPATGEMAYASAGHPPILVVESDGTTRWLDQAAGTPLCTGTVETRARATTILRPGSTVVLYSDGLVERRHQSLFDGLDRLAAVARGLRSAPMAGLADRIIDDMASGVGDPSGAPSGPAATRPDEAPDADTDDIVVLAFRFEAATATPFQLDIDADPRQLSQLRSDMRTWLRGNGVDAMTLDRALLLVGEACANSIDHAYLEHEGGEQPIHVELWFDDTGLNLEVRDRGRWRTPGLHGADRGRGTMIMTALAGRFERTTGGGGTVVRMHLQLTGPASARPAQPGVRP
jgi:PAS domain S-box-containing protein